MNTRTHNTLAKNALMVAIATLLVAGTGCDLLQPYYPAPLVETVPWNGYGWNTPSFALPDSWSNYGGWDTGYPAYGLYDPTDTIQGAIDYRLEAMENSAAGWSEFILQ